MAIRPVSSDAEAVRIASFFVAKLLRERGFRCNLLLNDKRDGGDVLVAVRSPRGIIEKSEDLVGDGIWIGIFGHVDVEEGGDEKGWTTRAPFQPTLKNERVYCRGIADNLGPLLLRILAFSADDKQSPGVVWIIHGEEEIGSPFAHKIFPKLREEIPKLSKVHLWLEETGYFPLSKDQDSLKLSVHSRPHYQRILFKNHEANPRLLDRAIAAVESVSNENDPTSAQLNKKPIREERYLNKAFGTQRCPCLTHLVGTGERRPYLAIGPNDSISAIHEANESLPVSTLRVSFEQFQCLLSELSHDLS